MSVEHAMIKPILLLLISNVFMTYAWYGHLRDLSTKPLWMAVILSWMVAFFEYCFQVPGNRLGFEYFTLPQLKVIQEVLYWFLSDLLGSTWAQNRL